MPSRRASAVVTFHFCPAPRWSHAKEVILEPIVVESITGRADCDGLRTTRAAAYADAHRLVEKLGLKKLADAGAAEIRESCGGMTPNAAQRLMAGVEIGLRIAELKSEYEINLEVERDNGVVGDPGQIRERVRDLDMLARQSVDEELQRSAGAALSVTHGVGTRLNLRD